MPWTPDGSVASPSEAIGYCHSSQGFNNDVECRRSFNHDATNVASFVDAYQTIAFAVSRNVMSIGGELAAAY